MKTAPPSKGFGRRSCEGVALIRPEEQFEFPISAEKSVSISVEITCFLFFLSIFFFGDHLFSGGRTVRISDFGRKFRLNFGENLFFSFFKITKRLTTGPFQYCPR